MGKVYIGQTALKIEVDLKANLTDASVKLKFKKPTGEAGEFAMIITDTINGIAKFEAQTANTFNVAGTWTFWAYVTYGNGKVAAGEVFIIRFYKEGM